MLTDEKVTGLYTKIIERSSALYNCLVSVVHVLNALDAKFEAIRQFSAIKQPYTAKIL